MTSDSRADLGIAFLAMVVGLVYYQVDVDDPYITFRYAANWANGHGLVFNPGERVLGTTAPLFALILGVGATLGADIVTTAGAISIAALAASGVLIAKLLAHEGRAVAGRCAALFLVTHPLIGDAQGFELNLVLAFCFGGALAYLSDRPVVSGLLLAAATLTRGDGFVPAGLIGLHALWTSRGAFMRFAVSFAMPVVGAIVIAYAFYGNPLPGTLAAKRAMGQSEFWRGYLYGGARVFALYAKLTPPTILIWLLSIAGLSRVWNRGDLTARWLLVWTGSIAVAYAVMGIPSAYNYYAAWVPCLSVLAGLGAESISRRYAWPTSRLAVGVAILVAFQLWPAHRAFAQPEPRYHSYRNAAIGLASFVEPEARVAAVEIGILGYFTDRRILDLVGLTEPRVRGAISRSDGAWGVRELAPEYVLFHDPPWQSIETAVVAAPWFDNRYTLVHTFEGDPPYRLTLYRLQARSTAPLSD